MSVLIIRRYTSVKRRGRGGHFDRAVATLAPSINKFWSDGICDVRKLAELLNEAGIYAPSGRRFTYGTMHRVLRRLRELRLGSGPRSLSVAASRRAVRPYKHRSKALSKPKLEKFLRLHGSQGTG
jgi:hypothetical protein